MEKKVKPKYTTEQLLEAIQASPFDIVVKSVDGDKVEVSSPFEDSTLTVVSDETEVFILHTPVRYNTAWEDVIISSLRTALHILFDNKEASY
jgi:hypothetical protein